MNNPKTRVLIVDEDVAMAKYLAAHLSRRNFEVTVASSDQEALRIFRILGSSPGFSGNLNGW